jgi:hypothetical protein
LLCSFLSLRLSRLCGFRGLSYLVAAPLLRVHPWLNCRFAVKSLRHCLRSALDYSDLAVKHAPSNLLLVPVEPDLKRLIKDAAEMSRLSQADVMRSALRIGVPCVHPSE